MQDAEAGPASPGSTSPGLNEQHRVDTRKGKGFFLREKIPPDPPDPPKGSSEAARSPTSLSAGLVCFSPTQVEREII